MLLNDYDLNGNLLKAGTNNYAFDDENQLVSVWSTNQWREDYVYDGLNRRRITRQYTWTGSWTQTNEVRYIYDVNLVVQERDGNNQPLVTYTRGNEMTATNGMTNVTHLKNKSEAASRY